MRFFWSSYMFGFFSSACCWVCSSLAPLELSRQTARPSRRVPSRAARGLLFSSTTLLPIRALRVNVSGSFGLWAAEQLAAHPAEGHVHCNSPQRQPATKETKKSKFSARTSLFGH